MTKKTYFNVVTNIKIIGTKFLKNVTNNYINMLQNIRNDTKIYESVNSLKK
jgi:hypothetical protein